LLRDVEADAIDGGHAAKGAAQVARLKHGVCPAIP
jgi:hypothetical protein